LTGYITEHFGWRYAFYAPAVFSMLISFVWLYFVHDSPNVHPRITKAEKELIEKSLGALKTDKKKHWPPMNQVLTSLPFYALLLLHFGGNFGLFFLITAAPKFMSEVLKFKLTEAGILSSLPYLARLIAGYIFGSIGDTLRHKKLLGTTAIRKSFCIFCKLFRPELLHKHLVPIFINYSKYFILQLISFLDSFSWYFVKLDMIHTFVSQSSHYHLDLMELQQ
jgi:ACS family sodium-dependent inorganic phosphate cotransporter